MRSKPIAHHEAREAHNGIECENSRERVQVDQDLMNWRTLEEYISEGLIILSRPAFAHLQL
jgi:hypothetical protein